MTTRRSETIRGQTTCLDYPCSSCRFPLHHRHHHRHYHRPPLLLPTSFLSFLFFLFRLRLSILTLYWVRAPLDAGYQRRPPCFLKLSLRFVSLSGRATLPRMGKKSRSQGVALDGQPFYKPRRGRSATVGSRACACAYACAYTCAWKEKQGHGQRNEMRLACKSQCCRTPTLSGSCLRAFLPCSIPA